MKQCVIAVSFTLISFCSALLRDEPKSQKDDCKLNNLNLRDNGGEEVQLEEVDDTTFEATMCEGSTAFRVAMKLHDPLFGSGIACKLSGVPKGPTKIDHGKTEELKF